MSQPSLGQKVRQLQGLLGTKDVKPSQEQFITDMWQATQQGKKTSHLTGPQVEYIDGLWKKHYGGRR
jgi:hypothetical protein